MMAAEFAETLIDAVAAELAGQGFVLRGGFMFSPDEAAPMGPAGARARSVLLVGQAGAGPWPHFQRWRSGQPAGLSDPYDRFSESVLATVAARHGARAVSPSDRPYLPFQQWAMRAGRTAAIASRHPDASRIWALARLPGRLALRHGSQAAGVSRGGSPLRRMSWKTLPECLSGRCPHADRLRAWRLPCACPFGRWAGLP